MGDLLAGRGVDGKGQGCPQYLAFTGVDKGDVKNMDKFRPKNVTVLYEPAAKLLVVKLRGGPFLHSVRGMFENLLRLELFKHGASSHLVCVGATRFENENGMKEADVAFKQLEGSTKPFQRDWPSIAFEVGKSIPQLQAEAKFWLSCSQGKTHVVIIVGINETERMLEVQRWEDRHGGPARVQSIVFADGGDYIGPPLLIPVEKVFDNGLPPGVPRDGFQIPASQLNELSGVVWA